MKTIKTVYSGFCKAEETLVAVFVAAMTFLVFASAIARGLGRPINWAADFSLLLLAWVVFLGADSALRHADFIRVDMLSKYFPEKVREALYYFFYTVAIVFLAVLIRFGIPLSILNYRRNFQALQISYSWATISVPVGAFFMIVTIVLKLVRRFRARRGEAA